MLLTLNQLFPDFSGISEDNKVTLDTYSKYVKIILGSEVFNTNELKYLSDTLEYQDLLRIIIFNSKDKTYISKNTVYIDTNDEVIDKNKACIVDKHNIIQYVGDQISDIERDCMVILSGLGCTLSRYW
jgi:hypothetical protein